MKKILYYIFYKKRTKYNLLNIILFMSRHLVNRERLNDAEFEIQLRYLDYCNLSVSSYSEILHQGVNRCTDLLQWLLTA